MVRVIISIALLSCLPWSGNAQTAQTPYSKLFSSGSWMLITGPFELADDKPNKVVIYDGTFCHARTERRKPNLFVFSIIYLNKKRDFLLQIGSKDWAYDWREHDMIIKSGNLSLTLQNAYYAGGHVEIVLRGKTADTAEAILQAMSDLDAAAIEVLDYRKRKIAIFSSSGMQSVLKRAQECAERHP